MEPIFSRPHEHEVKMPKDRIVKLDDKPIKSIGWWFDPSDYNCIQVGKEGVTKIDCVEQFCGEYSIFWMQVWKENVLYARYNARNIDNIAYEDFYFEDF